MRNVVRWLASFLFTMMTVWPGPEAEAQTFSEQGASVLPGAAFNSRSASLADIDGDGDLDLFFQGAGGAQQMLRNNLIGTGTLSYTNISGILPSGLGPSWSAAWGDYDGDRQVDVFVGQSNIGTSGDLLKNNGGLFSNVSASVGLDDPGFHQNVAWNDIDNDEDLDLIIAMEGPELHELYLQNASGTFNPVGNAVGLQVPLGYKAYGMAVGDTDGDGDLDIYISTCRADNNVRNNFFENRLADTGTLSFVDIADSNGTQFMQNSYGAEFHDLDDDGDLDLFMVGADGQKSKIFRNDGGNQFTDIDDITGVPLLSDVAGDLNGGRAVDYDNDGDLDLFFHDHKPNNGANKARKLYRNDGNWQFTDVTQLEGIAGIRNEGAYDSVWGDIDMDGDQDLIAPTDNSEPERVFLSNASANGNHWLYVELAGTDKNSTAIGATVYATLDAGTPQERTLRREANTNAGTFNQSDLPVHFGLGSTETIDELRVVFPNGTERTLQDVPTDQYLLISHLLCDLEGDGRCDIDDLNEMLAMGPIRDGVLVSDGANPVFDLTGDGVIDLADRDAWLASAAAENGFLSPYKLGDANLDGTVDGQDYLQWNANKFTTGLLWDEGNFTGDAVIDGQDFIVWNANKFTSADRLPPVPEPCLAWAGWLGWLVVIAGRGRRSCSATARHRR